MNQSTLEDEFDAACSYVARLASSKELDDRHGLRLYGLYKQATEGQCSTPKPSLLSFDFTQRKKWNSWNVLGEMPRDTAARLYVEELTMWQPGWRQQAGKSQGRMGGPVFSSLIDQTDDTDRCEEGTQDDPIIAATREGDLERVRQLLGSGICSTARDVDGCTALHWAADRGHLGILELLIESNRSLLFERDNDGMTCLHYACLAEKKDVFDFLCRRGGKDLMEMACNEGQKALELAPSSWSSEFE